MHIGVAQALGNIGHAVGRLGLALTVLPAA
jgi:hypothetical protein